VDGADDEELIRLYLTFIRDIVENVKISHATRDLRLASELEDFSRSLPHSKSASCDPHLCPPVPLCPPSFPSQPAPRSAEHAS
jgi:hypothetical protein